MEAENSNFDKKIARRECFERIDELSGGTRAAASLSICATLKSLGSFQRAQTIIAYTAMMSEPNLAGLFWGGSKKWGFSTVGDHDELEFYGVLTPNQLISGPYGFREPDKESCIRIKDSEIDLILVPGVGFDPATGHRLGRGKGHYDRFLARITNLPKPPPIIGIAFSTQLCSLQPETHDIPMDKIVTEHGRLQIRNSISRFDRRR